ncbi:MAG: acyl-CoA carboxylase biotin carboxyl carrier protein subunit, partial [Planctomycetota bacterium]
MKLFAHTKDRTYDVDLADELDHLVVSIGKESFILRLDTKPGAIRTAFLSGGKDRPARKIEFAWTRKDGAYVIVIDGITYDVELRDPRSERAALLAKAKAESSGAAEVRAPIPGRVTRILAAAGTKVEQRQAVLMLDAMKLENEIQAPRAGAVRS